MSFYNLTNFITNENYLFIPLDTDIKTAPSATRIFKYDIRNYSIMDFKKLLFVLMGIPYEKQHLWIENKSPSIEIINNIIRRHKYTDTDLDGRIFDNFPQILGYLYRGEEGINYYNPNILDLDYNDITKDPSDLYIDLHECMRMYTDS